MRRTAERRMPAVDAMRVLMLFRFNEYVRVFGAMAAAAARADRSLSLTSADIEMLRTRDNGPCPIPIMAIRTEKYIASATAITKHNQNQTERFMGTIVSYF